MGLRGFWDWTCRRKVDVGLGVWVRSEVLNLSLTLRALYDVRLRSSFRTVALRDSSVLSDQGVMRRGTPMNLDPSCKTVGVL